MAIHSMWMMERISAIVFSLLASSARYSKRQQLYFL